MGKFSLVFKQSVANDLREIPKKDVSRFLYEIQDDVLVMIVVKVGHQRDVYKRS